MRDWSDAHIRRRLEPYGVSVTPALAQAIREYTALLLQWNARTNLTRITDPDEILGRHFGESLFAGALLRNPSGKLADVGSGAGFPGLALKLACPLLEITLIESNMKKATFLAEVQRKLDLKGVEILRARMEDVHTPRFDQITARAIGKLDELLQWAGSSLAPGGGIILWLGDEDVHRLRKHAQWDWADAKQIPNSRGTFILAGQPK